MFVYLVFLFERATCSTFYSVTHLDTLTYYDYESLSYLHYVYNHKPLNYTTGC